MTRTSMIDYGPLWYWISEREAIRVRKESGAPPPWTQDPILSTHRFCCVRREDDRVTQWLRKNVREPFAEHPLLWLMLAASRQINWPDTIAELIAAYGAWPSHEHFSPTIMGEALEARRARGEKVYTGAYVIPAPRTRGASKQAHLATVVIGGLWHRRDEFVDWDLATLRGTHERLTVTDGWGDFLAYQAVVDMRFTKLLASAPDVSSWAAAGPGTIRGLHRIHGRPIESSLPQAQALDEIRAIYEIAPGATGVALDFSDVPNVLCEVDKYLRVKNGEGRPRTLYVPGRGS